MALIICSECGAKISDKATSCPHCGNPMNPSATTTPPLLTHPESQQATASGPDVGLFTHSFTCPGCGTRLESKHIMSSGWAKCPVCKHDVQLGGINSTFSDDGLVEKIYPFGCTSDDFHARCMQHLMDMTPADFFSEITDVRVSKNFIWVREFGVGESRQIYPMCSYGEEVLSYLGGLMMSQEVYENIWPTRSMKEFNSSHIKDATLKPKEMSSKECKHRYTTAPQSPGYGATHNYYCLPVFEEEFTYKGQRYRMVGSGDGKIKALYANGMPQDNGVLTGEPKYTSMTPLTYTAIGILIILAVITAIGIYSKNGFLWGTIALVIIGFVAYLVGLVAVPVIGVFTVSIDTIIQKSINSYRRRKFRRRFEEIQIRKKEDAARKFNLNLTYSVPDFPIP